ncbi:GNAT family N-acetyltransferase [Alteromonas sp. CYL-A6]|uniref:GNAT family N-acetyltransferase n=1 Tax=Alteromonas nitratireducens TaxID=3390813 RepID=UPI0034A78187
MQIDDTDRLQFHFIDESDAEFLWELGQDEAVMQYINGGKKTTREDVESVFLPRLKAFSNPSLGWGLWRVDLKDTGEKMGWILVRPFGFFSASPDPDNIELGWRFMRAYWGNGYAVEAVKQVQDALIELGVQKFSAIADPKNTRSVRVMEKLGMQYKGTERYTDELYDGDVVVYEQVLHHFSR